MNLTIALGILSLIWVSLCVLGALADFVADEVAYLKLRAAHRSRMRQRAQMYRATH